MFWTDSLRRAPGRALRLAGSCGRARRRHTIRRSLGRNTTSAAAAVLATAHTTGSARTALFSVDVGNYFAAFLELVDPSHYDNVTGI